MASQIVKIMDHFWSVEMGFVRAFLAEGDECAYLFDTGIPGDDLRSEIEAVTDKKIIVLNTHSDFDHVGCNGQFDEVWLHPGDYFKYFHDGGKTFYNVKAISDGQIFDNGLFRFEAISLPGHTPGSVAFLEKEKRFLIAGDMFSLMLYMYGEGRSIYAYRESLSRLNSIRNEFDKMYVCHGDRMVTPDAIDNFTDCVNGILDGSVQGIENNNPVFDIGKALIYSTGKANIAFDPAE